MGVAVVSVTTCCPRPHRPTHPPTSKIEPLLVVPHCQPLVGRRCSSGRSSGLPGAVIAGALRTHLDRLQTPRHVFVTHRDGNLEMTSVLIALLIQVVETKKG